MPRNTIRLQVCRALGLALIAAMTVSGCGAERGLRDAGNSSSAAKGVEPGSPRETGDSEPSKQAEDRALATTYLVSRDYRRCPSPRCAGFWLQAVDRDETICPDGTAAESCYVPTIDWSLTGIPQARGIELETRAGRLIVEGSLVSRVWEPIGDLGELRAARAWSAGWGPEADRPTRASYLRVRRFEIDCAAPPCHAFELTPLGGGPSISASSVDLTSCGADENQIRSGMLAADESALIVAGTVADVAQFYVSVSDR